MQNGNFLLKKLITIKITNVLFVIGFNVRNNNLGIVLFIFEIIFDLYFKSSFHIYYWNTNDITSEKNNPVNIIQIDSWTTWFFF